MNIRGFFGTYTLYARKHLRTFFNNFKSFFSKMFNYIFCRNLSHTGDKPTRKILFNSKGVGRLFYNNAFCLKLLAITLVHFKLTFKFKPFSLAHNRKLSRNRKNHSMRKQLQHSVAIFAVSVNNVFNSSRNFHITSLPLLKIIVKQ